MTDNILTQKPDKKRNFQWLFLILGPVVMLMTCLLDPPTGMSVAAFKTAGLAFWMASWWVSEVVPIPATALLPLVIPPPG